MSIAGARDSLLAHIAHDRAARCAEIIAHAEAEAAALLATARAAARRQLRDAVRAEQAQWRRQLAAAEARRQAARRGQRQRLAGLALTAAWAQLEPALVAHWGDPARRRRWLDQAIGQAARYLPAAAWCLHCPADLPADERAWLESEALARGARAVCCASAPGIVAGIAVTTDDACLDASIAGLLAERPAVEGRLLHHLHGLLDGLLDAPPESGSPP